MIILNCRQFSHVFWVLMGVVSTKQFFEYPQDALVEKFKKNPTKNEKYLKKIPSVLRCILCAQMYPRVSSFEYLQHVLIEK